MPRALLAALLLCATPAWAQDIGVHDAYALSAVPGLPNGAAYMEIRNQASEPDRLLGARSPAAEAVELHSSEEEDGIVRMRPVEGGLELGAGSVLLLDRGGPHLMMMGLTEPLVDGEVIPVTLVFEKAGEVEVEVLVDLDRLTEGGDAGEAEAHDHGAAEEDHSPDAEEASDHGASEDDHAGH